MPEPSWVIDLSPGRLAVTFDRAAANGLTATSSHCDGPALRWWFHFSQPRRLPNWNCKPRSVSASFTASSTCRSQSRIDKFPQRGRSLPLWFDLVAERIKGGFNVVIHCRMGTGGRSALVAACVLGILGQTTELASETLSVRARFSCSRTCGRNSDWAVDFVRNCDESAAGEAPRS